MPVGALNCAFLMELPNLEEAFTPTVPAHVRPFESAVICMSQSSCEAEAMVRRSYYSLSQACVLRQLVTHKLFTS